MNSPVTHRVDADGIGWIVFDAPDSRANIFNPATQAALHAALDAFVAGPPRALVITSAKDRIFLAGADLAWLASLPDAAAATEFSRAGQRLFDRVAASRVPVVCAIHGACAGGGFELALACHWRIATDSAVTQLGLPETGIGTIPGWGGCVRLPRLVGGLPAAEHILKAQLVPAAAALAAGFVDEVVPAAELTARATAAALRLAVSGAPIRAVPPVAAAGAFAAQRAAIIARTRGHQPAPVAALDVLAQSATLPTGAALELEAHAFGLITAGPVCKNLLHAFAVRESAKKRTLAGWFAPSPTAPAVVPIARVGVVGAGVMGSGIAHWLATHGGSVVLRDVREDLLTRGRGVIDRLFDDAVHRGRLTATDATAARARIALTTAWDGFAACDLVIEAIVENAAAKRALFSELAALVPPTALLASNTSALPIEEIAGHVPHPGRTLGLHFFNPVSRMPLVELIVGRDTTAETAARALSLVKSLGKSPVICRSSPGFLVTRVLFFYLNEAVRLWEQGASAASLDAALRDFGWPMGPLRLIDEVGVDVTDFIFGEMAHYFPDRFVRTTACAELLTAGLTGRKNGASAGFYRYDSGREALNDAANAAITHRAAEHPADADDLREQLMGVMIDEARRCLDEGVVRSPDDVDFALSSGAGFPAFRGGLMRYAAGAAAPAR